MMVCIKFLQAFKKIVKTNSATASDGTKVHSLFSAGFVCVLHRADTKIMYEIEITYCE